MGITRHRLLETVAACTLILIFKFYITSFIQGTKRPRAPEDRKNVSTNNNPNIGNTNTTNTARMEATFDEIVRWQRIVINDLENIPIFLIVMWISYFISPDSLVTFIPAIVFTVFRILHSISYIFRLQPVRTICWVIGLLATLVLTCNIMYAAANYHFLD